MFLLRFWKSNNKERSVSSFDDSSDGFSSEEETQEFNEEINYRNGNEENKEMEFSFVPRNRGVRGSSEMEGAVETLQAQFQGAFSFDVADSCLKVKFNENKNNAFGMLDKLILNISHEIDTRGIKGLKGLQLDLQGCYDLTDKSAVQLIFDIKEKLGNLLQLRISFAGSTLSENIFLICRCWRLTDEGISKLSSDIGDKLWQLQELELDFSRCCKLTDKGIQALANGISSTSKKLQILDLNFSGCLNLGDKSLEALAYILNKKFRYLQRLSLNFAGCPGVTDKGVEVIGLNIGADFLALQELSLAFSNCERVSSRSVENLAANIAQGLTHLNKLTLRFLSCKRVDESTKLFVREKLDHVPTLLVT